MVDRASRAGPGTRAGGGMAYRGGGEPVERVGKSETFSCVPGARDCYQFF